MPPYRALIRNLTRRRLGLLRRRIAVVLADSGEQLDGLCVLIRRGVSLRQIEEQRVIGEHALHQGWVNTVAFSPDGSRLASAGRDGIVYLWDITSSDLKYVTIQNPGPYDGMNIQGVTGLTPPQMEEIIVLGARK